MLLLLYLPMPRRTAAVLLLTPAGTTWPTALPAEEVPWPGLLLLLLAVFVSLPAGRKSTLTWWISSEVGGPVCTAAQLPMPVAAAAAVGPASVACPASLPRLANISPSLQLPEASVFSRSAASAAYSAVLAAGAAAAAESAGCVPEVCGPRGCMPRYSSSSAWSGPAVSLETTRLLLLLLMVAVVLLLLLCAVVPPCQPTVGVWPSASPPAVGGKGSSNRHLHRAHLPCLTLDMPVVRRCALQE